MKARWDLSAGSMRWVILYGVMAFVLFPAGLMLIYNGMRDSTLQVGDLGDAPFVSGFYGDEADLTYRYRWTKGRSIANFEGLGSADVQSVEVWAQTLTGSNPDAPHSITVTLNSALLGTASLSDEMRAYNFTVNRDQSSNSALLERTLEVGVESTTFRPAGDERDLGVKIDRITLRQARDAVNLPPIELFLWGAVLLGALFLLLWHAAGLFKAIGVVAGTALLLLTTAAVPSLVSRYIHLASVSLLVIGAVAAARPWHRRWPEAIEAVGNSRVARIIMLAALAIYGAVSLWTILNIDWIGHADYAENAVIARNLVEGRGLTVDYVAQFYKEYPGISHPAETWPLLQPLMIAPFFMIFGPETWAAKLPNLFVMLALAWVVFHVGTRLFDARVGLLVGLFTLSHPYFFNSVLYPINDLAFTLLFFLLAWVTWSRFSPQASFGPTQSHVSPRLRTRDSLIAGALAGLLVWSKPSGALLLVGLGLWVAWTWMRYYRSAGNRVPWRAVAIVAGTALLVLLPMFVRNLITFGVPFYSTESLDASILRYWNGDQTLWERIYKVYVGQELPHPRWIVGGKFGYDLLFDAVGRNIAWVWQRGIMGSPGEGDYVFGFLPLAGALLGLSAAARRVVSLIALVGLCLTFYAMFVLGYWHFEGRYFQVMVPWLYLLLAWGLLWLWDRLDQSVKEGKGRHFRLILLPMGLAVLFWPNLEIIQQQIERDTRPTGYVATLKWIAANSGPSDVVMTRDPWELNWHSGRRAVMIPFDDLPTIERIAEQYGVTMMQLGGPVDRVDETRCPENPSSGGNYPTGSRPALGSLYCGVERAGYTLVFKDRGGTIYRLDRQAR